MSDNSRRGVKTIKYAWAALLSLSVAGLALTDGNSAWRPLLNGLIDLLQQQHQPEGTNNEAPLKRLLRTGQIPAGPGALNFPPREKVQPAATNGPAVATPHMAP